MSDFETQEVTLWLKTFLNLCQNRRMIGAESP